MLGECQISGLTSFHQRKIMSASATLAKSRQLSPRSRARVAGGFYLLNIVTIFVAIFFLRGIIVSSDVAATAANVLAHETSFRLGFALELISTACSIAVTALL